MAVFDADGTLWGDDLGERHLQVLERRENLTVPPPHSSLFEAYGARCAEDTDEGYAFAVSCMAGLAEQAVVDSAILAWVGHRHLVPDAVRSLLDLLEERSIEVWLVSASNRWAIETAGVELGVAPERVIAMSSDVVDGTLGAEVHRPLSNGSGKAALIRERIGVRPLLAMGNSKHDMEMLLEAEVGVVVRLAGEAGMLPETCPILEQRAREQGWYQRALYPPSI